MCKNILFAIALLVLTFWTIDVKADTLSLSGGVNFSGFLGSFSVNFAGTNSNGTSFGAFGSGSTVAGITFSRPTDVSGGTLINLGGSAFLIGADFNFGSVSINGTSYPVHTVDIQVTPTFVTVPFTTDNTIMLNAPCSVSGGVSGQNGFQIVGAGFTGVCNATLTLTKMRTDSSGNGVYNYQSLSFGFARPVPEPTTILLLGSGLVAIAVKVRRVLSIRHE
jgi:hypothetical protein